jgi:hypothetical protein
MFLKLVGGDWNHGILNDFPETVGNVIIPTDELIFFGGVAQAPASSCFTMVPSGNQVWQAPCTDVVPESLYLSSANPIMIHHSISFHRF